LEVVMNSQIFAQPSSTKVVKEYGTVHNGRYHMPLLPGEQGPKDGSPWVSRGLQRMTNLVGAAEDTRALSIWEQAAMLIGLARSEELYEELVLMLAQVEADGIDLDATNLRDHKEIKRQLAGETFGDSREDMSIGGRAKRVARADVAAAKGTLRHAAWEHFGETGNLIGTKAVQESTMRTAALLADAGLQLIPGLQERVVRNVALGAVGKFDNVVLEVATGRMVMADLKTKVNPFFSRMALDAQLAGYARAEWMLSASMSHDGLFQPGEWYEEGPVHYVDQAEAVVMHVPSDGAPATLERCDLEYGWRVCLNAKEAIELRAIGKAQATHERAMQWGRKDLELTS
jgi:hypothetical protein